MSTPHRPPRRRPRASLRRAIVTVEFAVVAPVFLTAVVGIVEASRLYGLQNTLSAAAREGARLAAMDREGLLAPGQTMNDKVEADVLAYLEFAGVPTEDATVSVTDVDTGAVFDFDDPESELALFELKIELPYSAVNPLQLDPGEEFVLAASVVFRNGRAAIVE